MSISFYHEGVTMKLKYIIYLIIVLLLPTFSLAAMTTPTIPDNIIKLEPNEKFYYNMDFELDGEGAYDLTITFVEGKEFLDKAYASGTVGGDGYGVQFIITMNPNTDYELHELKYIINKTSPGTPPMMTKSFWVQKVDADPNEKKEPVVKDVIIDYDKLAEIEKVKNELKEGEKPKDKPAITKDETIEPTEAKNETIESLATNDTDEVKQERYKSALFDFFGSVEDQIDRMTKENKSGIDLLIPFNPEIKSEGSKALLDKEMQAFVGILIVCLVIYKHKQDKKEEEDAKKKKRKEMQRMQEDKTHTL